jgi:hypothetical protein
MEIRTRYEAKEKRSRSTVIEGLPCGSNGKNNSQLESECSTESLTETRKAKWRSRPCDDLPKRKRRV